MRWSVPDNSVVNVNHEIMSTEVESVCVVVVIVRLPPPFPPQSSSSPLLSDLKSPPFSLLQRRPNRLDIRSRSRFPNRFAIFS